MNDPEQGWAVAVNDRFSVYPFHKVRKQLTHADGDSVLAFYTSIAPPLNEVAIRTDARRKRPWWRCW